MYAKSAAYYDAICRSAGKDYAAEAEVLRRLLDAEIRGPGRRLLDVACGTGMHLRHLRAWYEVEGVDIEAEMVERARAALPGVPVHQADMHTLQLGRRFDAVTCLFSAIGYARTLPKLHQAIDAMASHLEPGGVLVVEPWVDPEEFRDGLLGSVFVDEPDLKVARMNVSRRKGRMSIIVFEYLVGTTEGIQRFSERHEVGLFTRDEYAGAFDAAGLVPHHEAPGLCGRGLYWARRES